MALTTPLVSDIGGRIDSFASSFSFNIFGILDIFLVALILYWCYVALRETRALGIIYGMLVLVVAFVGARILRLELLSLLIANFLTLLFVAIPVLFQPELRRLLERLGRTRKSFRPSREDYSETVQAVSEAAMVLAQNHTGALIVFRRSTGLADLSTSGVPVDAKVTAPLLLNLFFNKSPLHDGAVIIDRERIASAGVMLPLSEREYGHTLGARHRAAVGLTEQCDAVVLVVSEERGIISLVVGGKITPGINAEVLPEVLEEFLSRANPQTIVRKVGQKTKTTGKKIKSKVRKDT